MVRLLLAWLLAALWSMPLWAAAPPAGFVIKNRAEASYVPTGKALPETIFSNTVSVSVGAVEALTLTHDWTVDLPPGSQAVLPHILSNTGNVASFYSFSLVNLAGDGFDLSSLRLVLDANGNGLVDSDETSLTLGLSSLNLAAGRSATLLVTGVLPVNAGTASAQVKLTATTVSPKHLFASNTDTIRTGRQASIQLTKRADQAGSVLPGAVIKYHVVGTNIGDSPAGPTATAAPLGTPILIDGQPAVVLLIRDAVPPGTVYQPGSLTTSMPNAVRLFRLQADLPFQYRTNGDDSTAVELAVASPRFSLNPNVTTDMRFAVQVKADYSGAIPNAANAFFNDGSGPGQSTSNLVQLQVVPDRIGLAKRASQPVYEYDPLTLVPLGIARVRLSFIIESFSDNALNNVQLTDVLERAGGYGAYTTSALPAKGQYSVVPGSFQTTSLRNGATASASPDFTGTAAHAGLLAPGTTLPPRGAVEVSLEVRINASGIDGFLYNTATVSALRAGTGGGMVSAHSANGATPDANGDTNPSNDARPTPLLLSLPSISLQKSASEPRRVDAVSGAWEVDFTLTATNNGKSVATYVRVADNLNCTFRMYRSPLIVKSWKLVAPPVVQDGLLRVNAGFTGVAPCTTAQIQNTNPYLAMPPASQTMLTDGSRHLDPGASEVIRFTVRFVVDPLSKVAERKFTNNGYAASFDRQGATSAKIFAAAASSAFVQVIDPSGVTYNASTREPVAGTVVRLARLSCEGVSAGPITTEDILAIKGTDYLFNSDGSVSMKTGANGAYYFYFNSPPVTANCEYGLRVALPDGSDLLWPSSLIPPSSGLAPGGLVQPQSTPPAAGSPTPYYLQMRLGPGLPDVLNNHIPLDPVLKAGKLLLEKTSIKTVIEIGSSLEYTLRLKNVSDKTLTGYTLEDRLPQGFRYLSASARLDGSKIADPQGAQSNVLRFAFPALTLESGKDATLTYRVQSGIGTPLGDAINRAQAASGDYTSNLAERKVRVDGGVFSDEAYLFGKVFLDCNKDGIQGHEEVGIPGVRLIMEDGTGVVTDVEGKYSLYGLRAITHVLKLDATTLPPGSRLEVLDSRNSRQADSRFVDLKNGELHKANFAVDNCEAPEVKAEVEHRRRALADRPDAEGLAVSQVRLDLQTPAVLPLDQVRRREASGELTPTGITRSTVAAGARPAAAAVFDPVKPRDLTGPSGSSGLPPSPESILPRVELEDLLPRQDNTLAFLDLKNNDTLPAPVANVRVKGHLGATLQLTVNGRAQPVSRVGKRVRVAERQLEAWEYIGVDLLAGENLLLLEEVDSFGTVRGSDTIKLIAPGKMGKIEIDAPKTAVADGVTPVRIKVSLTDDKGVLVTSRTQLTLELDNGLWKTKDLNPNEPGTQVFLEGGQAEYFIIPPNNPLDASVRVSSGVLQKEVRIAYLPELRPLIGAGILEGVLDFRKKGLLPLGQSPAHAFEQKLRNFSRGSDDDARSTTARAAFYFKGTVRGEYLLTAAYDSDKSTRERLFRDIQPDKFYPIYGDSSTRLFDAQSTGRLYLRIDKQKSWLLFGDFTTSGEADARKLSQYSRAATGAKYHYEDEKLSANVYASRDSLTQVVLEIAANGTSGPYQLATAGELRENSEKVEILVRDRRQPGVILQTTTLTRFADYVAEPLSKQIRFAAPVASLDENLNPRFIRVTYELDVGGPSAWKGGVDAQYKLSETLQVGASYAHDATPGSAVSLSGLSAVVKLDARSVVTAELAQSETDAFGKGAAVRAEWIKDSDNFKLRAQATKSDAHFDNPTSGSSKGRTEATVDATYTLSKSMTLRTEGIYSKDAIAKSERAGVLATVTTRLGESVDASVGMRVSRDTAPQAGASSAPVSSASGEPVDLLTVRGRLSMPVPGIASAKAYVEMEQDVRDKEKRMLALGGDYQVSEKAKLYGRYEVISSLGNPYALNSTVQNNVAVLGLETSYLTDGRTFNEFRLRDAINGRELQAASGLRKTWQVAEGIRVGGSFENTKAFGGVAGSNSTAITGTVEYATDPRYRLYASAEARAADSGDSYLNTLGFAYKIDKDWSMLGRSTISRQKTSSDHSSLLQSRQQIGFAWRQVDIDRWNALGRYEYNLKDAVGGAAPLKDVSHTVSLHVNYQPERAFIASGRYAFKWGQETDPLLATSFKAHLLYGRVTQDLTRDLDISLQAAYTWGQGSARKYAAGLELGYHVISNLWVSIGYNMAGFHDDALTGGEYLNRGVYLRLRYKFDEGLFK